MLKGIFTPNLVPFLPDGGINEPELRRLVNWLIGQGVSGLYPNGSTGEFVRLDAAERRRVIRIVMEETRGRVPVLAGATEANLALTLEACREFAELGCTAASITGPHYYRVSQESIEEYFRELAAHSPLDLVLYNIPQFSNEISLPVLQRLALDCPRIVGVKDSSRDFPRLLATLHAIKPRRPDFAVFTGTEETLFPALLMGADGGTIATSQIVPEIVMALYRETLAGNVARARDLQFGLLDLIETMMQGGNFPDGFRVALALRGFSPGAGRQPLSARERGQLAGVRARIEEMIPRLLDGFGGGFGDDTSPNPKSCPP